MIGMNQEAVSPAITSLVTGVPSLVVPVAMVAASFVLVGKFFEQFGNFGVLGTEFGSEFRNCVGEVGESLTIGRGSCG